MLIESESPKRRYAMLVGSGNVINDPAQQTALDALDHLYHSITDTDDSGACKGVYFWGSVGRGKTFLMDLFADSLPVGLCLRLHFHHFMASIHQQLHQLEGQAEPLKHIAEKLSQQYRILCFDEFYVSDIGDAMLLGPLLQHLFELDVTLVATSNTAPENLYRDGLQRSRFIPAIHAIEQYTHTVHLTGKADHRDRVQPTVPIYHVLPDDIKSQQNLTSALLEKYGLSLDNFAALETDNSNEMVGTVEIMGRDISFVSKNTQAICFEFEHLCEGPRSQNDYILLAQQFQTLLLVNVPPLSGHAYERIKARGTEDGAVGSGDTGERAVMLAPMDDAARRLIALIDELYERKVVFVLSSHVPLNDLYTEGSLSFEFERAKSRLTEMASVKYQSQPHQP